MKKCPKRIDKKFSITDAAPQKTPPPQCCRMCPTVIPRSPCVNVALIWWWGRWWWQWWWWRWHWWQWQWWWSDLWNEGVALSKKTRWRQFELLQIFNFYRWLDFLKLGVNHCPKISTLVSSNCGRISILKCSGHAFQNIDPIGIWRHKVWYLKIMIHFKFLNVPSERLRFCNRV